MASSPGSPQPRTSCSGRSRCARPRASGRLHPEPEECSLRSPFQRDRDRIVHCKAFRRLKHKTQVFIAPEGDHYRTRLTHTIETTGISRTVARALRLNEDLTEAIGLGHDLGHPPFGHAGEAALDGALHARFGRHFRHNEHSLRVVDHLERDGRGLNLTHEVRDGILDAHARDAASIARGPDRAHRRSGRVHQPRHRRCAARGRARARRSAGGADPAARRARARGGSTRSCTTSSRAPPPPATSSQSPRMGEAMLELRAFLFARVYEQGRLRAETERAALVVRMLFDHYCTTLRSRRGSRATRSRRPSSTRSPA